MKTVLLLLGLSFLNVNCSFGQEQTEPLNETETKDFLQNLVYKYGEYLIKMNKNSNTITTGSFYRRVEDGTKKFLIEISVFKDKNNIQDSIKIVSTHVSSATPENGNQSRQLANELAGFKLGALEPNYSNKLKNESLIKINEDQIFQNLDSISKELSANKSKDDSIKILQIQETISKIKTHPLDIIILNDILNQIDSLSVENQTKISKFSQLIKTCKTNIEDAKTKLKDNRLVQDSTVIWITNYKHFNAYYNNYLLKNERPTRFYFGISGSANLSYRMLSTTSRITNSSEIIDERNQNEYMLPNISVSILAGIANYSHHFSITYTYQKFGFLFDQAGMVNPSTGEFFSNESSSRNQYSYIRSFGLQYAYSDYWKKWSPYVQFGVQFAFDTKGTQGLGNQRNNYFGTNSKLGIGLSYKPCYRAEFHLCPTGLIFLNSKEATYVNSRYFSVGIEIGGYLYFNRPLNKN